MANEQQLARRVGHNKSSSAAGCKWRAGDAGGRSSTGAIDGVAIDTAAGGQRGHVHIFSGCVDYDRTDRSERTCAGVDGESGKRSVLQIGYIEKLSCVIDGNPVWLVSNRNGRVRH